MASFNKVLLLGNLTRDPEVRYTPKGSAVADLGIAVNRQYTLDSGEKREEVTFVDVTFWGRTAEVAGEYLKKGRPVFIEGRLQLDTWDDKQSGQKRSKLKVIGEMMQMLGSRPGAAGDIDEVGAASRAPRSTAPPPKAAAGEPDDDEIPF
jgi:single-strand DNA-binding protein